MKYILKTLLENYREIEQNKIYENISREYRILANTSSIIAMMGISLSVGFLFGKMIGHSQLSQNQYLFVIICMFAGLGGLFTFLTIVGKELLRKKSYETELNIASGIQARLLPQKMPESNIISFAPYINPAKNVGGDYYDIIEKSPGTYAVIVADVSGKGAPAAILMATARAQLRSLLTEKIAPAEIIEKLNNAFYADTEPDRYITLFFCEIDTVKNAIYYVNAGHVPPYLIIEDKILKLTEGGLPVGMFPGSSYETGTITFTQGMKLVLYTDGITEAKGKNDTFFDEENLEKILRNSANKSPGELRDIIFDKLASFTKGIEQFDDITLLIAGQK